MDPTMHKQRYIFGSIFLLANKLQVIIDRGLAGYGITAKQWFLMAVLDEFFSQPPTLSELAEAMGSSHQNVKQIALKLEQKGFLAMERDREDGRAMRIRLTERCYQIWENRQEQDQTFFRELFQDISPEELRIFHDGVKKLSDKVRELE